MAERSEAVEEQAVRDGAAVYAVKPESATAEDVPPGYKRTEVGVIPEDWTVETIGSVFQPTAGGDHKPSRSSEEFRDEYQYPIYANAIQNKGLYGYANYATAKAGSITVTARGTLGHADFRKNPFVAIGRLLVLEPKQECEGFYFSEYINYGITFSVESTGVPQLTAPQVAKYPLPVPPLNDQRAIATALSDADALIESLDRLIAKKRAIKQAAMQQLLTGQNRLPGFTGEWKTKRLGDVASFYKGSGLSKADLLVDGSSPCIHYGELFTQYGERITTVNSRTDRKAACFKSIENDVLMPTSDVTPNGLATASCIAESNVILGGDILIIRPNGAEIDGTFLAYKIRMDHRQIMQLVSGTTVFHIYGRDMAEFTYKAPTTEEQQAIVSVLSDMDNEIEAVERRRDRARQIKQGMMQELLTGRTRLI